MSPEKPHALYVGSPEALSLLSPQLLPGVGADWDHLRGVLAAACPQAVLPFALPIVPDAAGAAQWVLTCHREGYGVRITAGYLDVSRSGYVSRVAVAPFRPLEGVYWVAEVAVSPLAWQCIQPGAYLARVEGAIRYGVRWPEISGGVA